MRAGEPQFRLEMGAEVTDLRWRGDTVTGVRVGDREIAADLTVACDGRDSLLRDRSGLPVREFPVPVDVLWFRLPRDRGAPPILGYLGAGQVVLAIDRGTYWQCGAVIGKGTLAQVRAAGLDTFRAGIAGAAPFLTGPLAALTDWDQVELLSVRTNRLRRWYRPGLLCIGDAAHAMSPAGAAGVNYAIADAVAAANALVAPLRAGTLTVADLKRVQRRRALAVRTAQGVQRRQTANLVRLAGSRPPLRLIRLIDRMPPVKRAVGRLIGLGFRREHVRFDKT